MLWHALLSPLSWSTAVDRTGSLMWRLTHGECPKVKYPKVRLSELRCQNSEVACFDNTAGSLGH